MALNTNVAPYYDDFDSTKNYHRILFKPGYAVQARELTQSQTILQDQITKLAQGVYSDGSVVTGGNITVDKNIVTCKLTQASNTIIDLLVGTFAVGSNSSFIAQVTSVDDVNYYINTKPVNNILKFTSGENINFFDSKLAALSFVNGGSDVPAFTTNAYTESTFNRIASGTYLSNALNMSTINMNVGDNISYTYSNTAFYATVVSVVDNQHLLVNQALPFDFNSVSVSVTSVASTQSMEVNVDTGVWFTNGQFVTFTLGSIIPQPLSIYPSCVVGFEVNEIIVDSYSDTTLLDPAISASNYQAPGADRYKIYFDLVSKPYINSQSIANLTTNKFIELIRIDNGVITNIRNIPSFSSIGDAIAKSVKDQSGDFIITKFNLSTPSTVIPSSVSEVKTEISAGEAYINGYDVKTLAPTPISLYPARDTESLTYQDITSYYGNYIRAKNINGSIPNFQAETAVEIHNLPFGLANTSSKIGTANIINFSYDSSSNTNTQYKVFLSQVKLQSNATLNVSSLIIPGTSNNYSAVSFSANTVDSKISDSSYNTLLFPFPQNNVANVTNVDYVTTRYYYTGVFNNGAYTINTNNGNETFVGASGSGGLVSNTLAQLNYMLVTTSASGAYPAGKFIPLDGTQANVSITINNSSTIPQATFNIGGGFNGTATILATISSVADPVKNKVLHTNQYAVVSANTSNTALDLGYSDIYNFNGVYVLGNTYPFIGRWNSSTSYSANNAVLYDDGNAYISLTNLNSNNTPNTSTSNWVSAYNSISQFILDNGQRDDRYDHGTITNPYGSLGNLLVTFDYFTHSGGSGYLSVNSYPVDYTKIPTYTSPSTGTTYRLSDSIDFRPRRLDGANTYATFQLPAPFNNSFIDYSYYLSRVDKIVLYPNGQFKTIRGISSYINPIPPADVNNTLTLFTLTYPAFTFNTTDISINAVNLRRYTMADIGLLDQRVTNLENYTSLSLLESQTTNLNVTDSTGQNLLFTNGFLVDGFASPDVADTTNPDYLASIDPISQLCRPYFSSNTVPFTLDLTQGNFINIRNGFIPSINTNPLLQSKQNGLLTLNNGVVTFSYDEFPMVYQNVASEIINVNPFNVLNFVGSLKISPSTDVWHSSQTLPQINIVNNDQAAWLAAVANTGLGTQWNTWQLNWTGQPTDTIINATNSTQISRDTAAITSALQAQGLKTALNGGLITVTNNQNIISTSAIPYCRSIPINFTVTGLTPYTQVRPYINNIAVDQYVNPITFNGGVYYIDVIGSGSGYTSGNNVSVTVTGNCATPAIVTANVVNGSVANVNIISSGSGYASPPMLTLNGSNTSSAILVANTYAVSGAPLVTDVNGTLQGILIMPNDANIQIPTGTVTITLTDNPINPVLAKSYASAQFYAQGTLDSVQTTTVSVRPPEASIIVPPPAPYIPPYNPPVVPYYPQPVTCIAPVVISVPGPTPPPPPPQIPTPPPLPKGSDVLTGKIRADGANYYIWKCTSYSYNPAGEVVQTTKTVAGTYANGGHITTIAKSTKTL